MTMDQWGQLTVMNKKMQHKQPAVLRLSLLSLALFGPPHIPFLHPCLPLRVATGCLCVDCHEATSLPLELRAPLYAHQILDIRDS